MLSPLTNNPRHKSSATGQSSEFRNAVFALIEKLCPSAEEVYDLSLELEMRSKIVNAKEDIPLYAQTMANSGDLKSNPLQIMKSASSIVSSSPSNSNVMTSPTRLLRSHSSLPPLPRIPRREISSALGPDEMIQNSCTRSTRKTAIEFFNVCSV
jgi:hypothetical protein